MTWRRKGESVETYKDRRNEAHRKWWASLTPERRKEFTRKTIEARSRRLKGETLAEQAKRRAKNRRWWTSLSREERQRLTRIAAEKMRGDPVSLLKRRKWTREWRRRREFGLEPEDMNVLIERQENRCAICKRRFDESSMRTSPRVDHDHKTGKVRGLLCGTCNSAIGFLDDSEVLLKRALAYLRGAKMKRVRTA
jgi:hypothetical protein